MVKFGFLIARIFTQYSPIFKKKLPNNFLNSGYAVKEGLIAKFGA
jgi:hypothetical protein